MRRISTRPVRLVAAVATALALGAAAPTASAAPAPSTAPAASPTSAAPSILVTETRDQRMARALRARAGSDRFGSSFSGWVANADTGERIWSRNGYVALKPASSTKLVTAHNALMTFGPNKRFTTSVKQGSNWNRVVIEGVGDPSLSRYSLDGMAQRIAKTMKDRGATWTRVYVDDDVFAKPSLAPGWKSSYVPDSVSPIRALIRDQRDSMDTSAEVGRYFVSRLAAHGMRGNYYGRANASSGAEVLATSQGQTMSQIVSRMLMYSDNEIAEALARVTALAKGRQATWGGVRIAQQAMAYGYHVPKGNLYDGSGLSRSDRLSAYELTRYLLRAQNTSYKDLATMRSSSAIPTAGRTGTLANRFWTSRSRCAKGEVWAKTGTLSDVSVLAGWTVGTDGRTKVFAFVVNGKKSTSALKNDLDMLAATVNGCY